MYYRAKPCSALAPSALAFPLSIHFEATYGMSAGAFDTFAEMLTYWSPEPPGPAC